MYKYTCSHLTWTVCLCLQIHVQKVAYEPFFTILQSSLTCSSKRMQEETLSSWLAVPKLCSTWAWRNDVLAADGPFTFGFCYIWYSANLQWCRLQWHHWSWLCPDGPNRPQTFPRCLWHHACPVTGSHPKTAVQIGNIEQKWLAVLIATLNVFCKPIENVCSLPHPHQFSLPQPHPWASYIFLKKDWTSHEFVLIAPESIMVSILAVASSPRLSAEWSSAALSFSQDRQRFLRIR